MPFENNIRHTHDIGMSDFEEKATNRSGSTLDHAEP